MIIAAILLHRPTRQSIFRWVLPTNHSMLTVSLRQERKDLLRNLARTP